MRSRSALAATFVLAAARYWLLVFPRACMYMHGLRARAREIPDPTLRELALASLRKRENIEGAAAFAALLPRRARARSVRALVAFQSAYNYLDTVAEQPCADPRGNARRLHEALPAALAPAAGRRDYYALHPQSDDGGYLERMLEDCREALAHTPAWPAVAEIATASAERIVSFQSLTLARDDDGRRDLRMWASYETPPGSGLTWFEVAAAGGSSLAVLALIAAAADPLLDVSTARAIEGAYFPWIGGLHSLLDSLLDGAEDAATSQLSLIGCYEDGEQAASAMGGLAVRAREATLALAQGSTGHLVLLAGMAASYLCDPNASSSTDAAGVSRAVRGALGDVVKPALFVFAVRRLPRRLPRGRSRRGRSWSAADASLPIPRPVEDVDARAA